MFWMVFLGAWLLPIKDSGEPKGGALADLTLHADLSLHECHEFFDDGESKACFAEQGVVVPSGFEKASRMRWWAPAGIPAPVSFMANRRVKLVSVSRTASMRTLVSPVAVNFNALLMRFNSACRNLIGSPRRVRGIEFGMRQVSSSPLRWAGWQRVPRHCPPYPEDRSPVVPAGACLLRFWRSRECR